MMTNRKLTDGFQNNYLHTSSPRPKLYPETYWVSTDFFAATQQQAPVPSYYSYHPTPPRSVGCSQKHQHKLPSSASASSHPFPCHQQECARFLLSLTQLSSLRHANLQLPPKSTTHNPPHTLNTPDAGDAKSATLFPVHNHTYYYLYVSMSIVHHFNTLKPSPCCCRSSSFPTPWVSSTDGLDCIFSSSIADSWARLRGGIWWEMGAELVESYQIH